MKIIAFLAILAIIASCKKHRDWQDECDPQDYKCNNEELSLVEKEFKICNESSYYSAYCFCQAKKNHCKKIKKGQL